MQPSNLKERADFTIVMPDDSAVADPYFAKDVAKLDGVQRNAARRHLNLELERVSLSQLLDELQWESLQSRR